MATKRKLSDEQIIAVMKQLEAGRTVAEMAREVGVSIHTVYAWTAKYGGMEPNEAMRLRHLEYENGRLRSLEASSAVFSLRLLR
jgi:putative transposase